MSPVFARHERRGLSYLRGGEGTPLVLLHGVPGSAHSWAPVGRHLAAHYDVILPDLSGFGHSGEREGGLHLDHEFYVEAHAETIRELLEDLGVESFFLGGHDFGGRVALTLIRLFPEAMPNGLVLSATRPFTDRPGPWPLRIAQVPGLGPVVVRFITGTRLGLRLLYWAAVRNKATFGVDAFERHLTPSGREQTRRITQRRLARPPDRHVQGAALLADLDVPTLVLWGDRDPLLSVAEGKQLVETLPRATLAVFKETGHFVPEERPAGVAGHIEDFFRAHSSRSTRPVWERWSPS
jgi:pimeloyl-ACP methyl ester carboxylesterase